MLFLKEQVCPPRFMVARQANGYLGFCLTLASIPCLKSEILSPVIHDCMESKTGNYNAVHTTLNTQLTFKLAQNARAANITHHQCSDTVLASSRLLNFWFRPLKLFNAWGPDIFRNLLLNTFLLVHFNI